MDLRPVRIEEPDCGLIIFSATPAINKRSNPYTIDYAAVTPSTKIVHHTFLHLRKEDPAPLLNFTSLRLEVSIPLLKESYSPPTHLAYHHLTAASIRPTSSGSNGPRSDASMHSRSSVRFFTPRTTVDIPSMVSEYRWANDAVDSP